MRLYESGDKLFWLSSLLVLKKGPVAASLAMNFKLSILYAQSDVASNAAATVAKELP
jgi:hypothetical protein